MNTIKQMGYLALLLAGMGLILLAASSCRAADWSRGWDSVDTVGQVAVTGLLVADWGQTSAMTRHYHTPTSDKLYYNETNPIMGSAPSRRSIATYFSTCIVGHALISYALPKYVTVMDFKIPARNIWQAVWIGIEAGQVRNNYKMGVGWKF